MRISQVYPLKQKQLCSVTLRQMKRLDRSYEHDINFNKLFIIDQSSASSVPVVFLDSHLLSYVTLQMFLFVFTIYVGAYRVNQIQIDDALHCVQYRFARKCLDRSIDLLVLIWIQYATRVNLSLATQPSYVKMRELKELDTYLLQFLILC